MSADEDSPAIKNLDCECPEYATGLLGKSWVKSWVKQRHGQSHGQSHAGRGGRVRGTVAGRNAGENARKERQEKRESTSSIGRYQNVSRKGAKAQRNRHPIGRDPNRLRRSPSSFDASRASFFAPSRLCVRLLGGVVMSVGQPERTTQNRVIALFRDELG